jgi:4-carboxymuconolactone decarboxylase
LILRVGWRCGSEYEFGQHTVIGRRAGITDDEVRRLTADDLAGWSDADALWVRAADELVADHRIGDDTWAALAARLTDQQIIDLLFTVGQYVLVSMALNTLGVERDEGAPGWPA